MTDPSDMLQPAGGPAPEVSHPGAHPSRTARRRWWVAALLSLSAGGLGQLYNGQPRKGLLLLASFLLALSLGSVLTIRHVAFWLPLTLILAAFALLLYMVIDAIVQAARVGAAYRLRAYNRWYVYLIYAAILSSLVHLWREADRRVVETFYIPSGSNEPTILIGDHLFVAMSNPRSAPRRGDFVIYRSPGSRLAAIKRVVAVGGDRVEIHNKQLLVNGRALVEPYVVHVDAITYPAGAGTMSQRDNLPPQTVSTGSLFLLGDNRDNSWDSRFFGPIAQDRVISSGPMRIYWSLEPRSGHTRWGRTGRFVE
ncbi:MAG TPA: signal peptidase I [Thermoanaerobaculia bacterium]|nr:signal peptidase I [Thermoanaerobaculia bacterium]